MSNTCILAVLCIFLGIASFILLLISITFFGKVMIWISGGSFIGILILAAATKPKLFD